mgnify:CR=1 FL=1
MTGLMKGITLKAQKPGTETWLDLSNKLSTYDSWREISYDVDFPTMDGEIIRMGKRERPIVQFTLLPCTGAELLEYFSVLRGIDGLVYLQYTDPLLNTSAIGHFWLDSNPLNHYMLKSVDNNVRYSIGEFVYKCKTAETYV